MEKKNYFWSALWTAILLFVCRDWWIGVNRLAIDWFNFVVIGGFTYWTFLLMGKAYYDYQFDTKALQTPPPRVPAKKHILFLI